MPSVLSIVKPSPEGTAFHAAVVVMVKVSDSPASPPSTRSSVLTVSVAVFLSLLSLQAVGPVTAKTDSSSPERTRMNLDVCINYFFVSE